MVCLAHLPDSRRFDEVGQLEGWLLDTALPLQVLALLRPVPRDGHRVAVSLRTPIRAALSSISIQTPSPAVSKAHTAPEPEVSLHYPSYNSYSMNASQVGACNGDNCCLSTHFPRLETKNPVPSLPDSLPCPQPRLAL